MKKHRVHTTISTKHWELLKKYTEKYETYQKVLEAGLESLENEPKQSPALSKEEQFWIRAYREMKSLCIVPRNILKALMETAHIKQISDVITDQKNAEYMMVWLLQKPLKKCSLKEIIDGLADSIKAANIIDVVEYIDDGNYFTLKVIHNMNLNTSKVFKIFIEDLFQAYGAKIESEISDVGFFIKVYKNIE